MTDKPKKKLWEFFEPTEVEAQGQQGIDVEAEINAALDSLTIPTFPEQEKTMQDDNWPSDWDDPKPIPTFPTLNDLEYFNGKTMRLVRIPASYVPFAIPTFPE